MMVHIGAVWRVRVNRPCGGDAALCQITLIACVVAALQNVMCTILAKKFVTQAVQQQAASTPFEQSPEESWTR